MFPIQCEEVRINHLTPLLVRKMPYTCWFLWWANGIEDFKWRLHFQFGVAFLNGCFERGIFWRAKSGLKGIEDFNLEHCIEAHILKKWAHHEHFFRCVLDPMLGVGGPFVWYLCIHPWTYDPKAMFSMKWEFLLQVNGFMPTLTSGNERSLLVQ